MSHAHLEQRWAELFRLIGEVGHRIASTLDIDELLWQIVGLIQDAFDYYHVGIGLIEGDDVVYRIGVGRWQSGEVQFEPARLKVGQEGLSGWVAGTGEPLLVPDVSQEPRYRWMRGSETRSEVTVPIITKGEVIGVLDVQSDLLDAFDEIDLIVLQSLAHQTGVAIHNAQLFRAEQRRREQFQAISEMGHRITSILPVNELLWEIVHLVADLGYYMVSIGLIEGDEVIFRVGIGPSWKFGDLELRLRVGQDGVCGLVAQTGEPAVIPDVSREPLFLRFPEFADSRSEIAVPLRTKEAIIGVLNVESDHVDAFDDSDVILLQSLADQAAIAIENARLYEQTQQLAVLEERQRLARELHDSVTQYLYGVMMYTEAAARLLVRDQEDAAFDYLLALRETAREALQEIRLLIFELRPPVLQQEGLETALQARLEAVEGRAGLKTSFSVEGAGRLPLAVEEGLYRIALEALNNALRHAQARSLVVHLVLEQPLTSLEIRDDGIGFDPAAVRAQGGMGLPGMYERAAKLGGKLTVVSKPGEGTTIRVEIER